MYWSLTLCTAWWFMCTAWWFMYCLMIYVLLDDLRTAWWFMDCLMIYGLLDDICTAWWFIYCLMIYVLLDDLWLVRSWSFMNDFVLFFTEQTIFKETLKKIIVLLNERFVSNKLIFIKMNDFTELINDHSVRKQMKKVENEW